jgi:Undecaprenyl-phosphate galactose phosphotransferase WbaP
MEAQRRAYDLGVPLPAPQVRAPKPRAHVADRRRHPRVESPDARTGLRHAARAIMSSVPLVASDLISLMLALTVAHQAFSRLIPGSAFEILPAFALLSVGLVAANLVLGLYPGIGLHGVVELRQSTTAAFLIFGAVTLAEWFRGESFPFVSMLLFAGVATAVAVPLLRAATRTFCARFSWWSHPVLVIGAEPAAREIADYFEGHPGLGLKAIPVYLNGNGTRAFSTIQMKAREHRATSAAVALAGADVDSESFLVRYCTSLFPSIVVLPEPGIVPNLWTQTTVVAGMVGVQTGTSLYRPVPRLLKRTIDCSFALLIAALALPLLVLIALAVRLSSPGPVFYSQQRVGRGRQSFKAWKFRTMYQNADEVLKEYLASDLDLRREWARDHKLRNDPRITPIGRLLRRASLDELPQLWNIIRGDMSLVGPRPIVLQEIPKYGQEFGYYVSVPPGLTGLWQVSGRNKTTYEERVAFDSYYVQNWSVWLDIHILARTVRAVLTADGAC